MKVKFEAWLLVSVLVAIAFSGCGAKDEDHDHEDGSHDDHEGMGSNNTTMPHVMAAINVTVDGTESSAANGSIPLVAGVNVTFDGSGSMGDNLTFAWDFGDNGTGTNASEVHVFTDAGLYNVSLTVSSANVTDTATISVNVTAGGPGAGAFAGTDSKSFTGSLTVGNPNACSPSPANGYDCKEHKFTIAAAAPDGTPAMAKVVRVRMTTSSSSATQMTIYLLSPASATLKSSSNAPPAAASPLTITHEADSPPGDYAVRVRLNAGANVSYTVTVEVDYFAT